ncbi:MAG TPA: DNA repair protein RecN, partial [Chloroflexi bacterium]|nr:DNA repair protein RecN [Chloroflexota bacterium]
SDRHQVIVISHLPQIAAFADHHITLIKQEEENRTVTTAITVSGDARINEVAAMLDGLPITSESRASANALLQRAAGWKTADRSAATR